MTIREQVSEKSKMVIDVGFKFSKIVGCRELRNRKRVI